ncbi:hypothetical protein G6541_08400 [Streptomyces albidoflavus]|nr:hypothetical protein [Streptomyces albidoflavus]
MAVNASGDQLVGVFRAVERAVADAPWVKEAFLECGDGARTILLSPAQARRALYGRDSDPTLSGSIWRRTVALAHSEPEDERAKLLAVWFALPRLYRSVWRITDRFRWVVDTEDVEAEVVAGILLALSKLNGDEPDPDDILVRAALSHGWAVAKAESGQHKANIAVRGEAVHEEPFCALPGFSVDSAAESAWEMEVAPPARPDGLSAPVRFTVSKSRLEGERLGSLAERYGLREVVLRARRPSAGPRVGRVSLRPAGAQR